jgi:hypothetical protein
MRRRIASDRVICAPLLSSSDGAFAQHRRRRRFLITRADTFACRHVAATPPPTSYVAAIRLFRAVYAAMPSPPPAIALPELPPPDIFAAAIFAAPRR